MIKLMSLVFVSFFCLSSCFSMYSYGTQEKMVGKILQKLGGEIKKEYNLSVIGTTVGMPGGIIEVLGLELQACRVITKEEARKILIRITQMFLVEVNSNEKIRGGVKIFPFTNKNVKVTIYILNADGNSVYHPDIRTSSINKGELSYRTVDILNPYTYKTDITESYEEALKAIENKGS